MKETKIIEKQELERFLDYMYDKINECYKEEVKIAIKRFLEE